MTENEEKAISLRAAINERAERLRNGGYRTDDGDWIPCKPGPLKQQIRDLEHELSSLS